jgi:hypothetical protein
LVIETNNLSKAYKGVQALKGLQPEGEAAFDLQLSGPPSGGKDHHDQAVARTSATGGSAHLRNDINAAFPSLGWLSARIAITVDDLAKPCALPILL